MYADARMNPATFDQLVRKLEREVVFHNNYSNGERQIPVDQQLFTTLIRMGVLMEMEHHYQKLVHYVGWEKGTVDLITRDV